MPTSTMPSLNGRRFRLISSTTSVVDPLAPSTFTYYERDGVIWGEYEGDTVTFGRDLGTRTGDRIDIRFVHVLAATGEVVTGEASSVIERDDATGLLRLVEDYQMFGEPQQSVCEEIPAD